MSVDGWEIVGVPKREENVYCLETSKPEEGENGEGSKDRRDSCARNRHQCADRWDVFNFAIFDFRHKLIHVYYSIAIATQSHPDSASESTSPF